MPDFRLHLTEEQYDELAQFWHEFMVLGPRRQDMGLDRTSIALTFSQWIDSDPDEDPEYGLPEILAFFDEKERREGTAYPESETLDQAAIDREYHTALREGGYDACFPEQEGRS